MKIDDLQKSQDFVLNVSEFIAAQHAAIVDLQESLDKYIAWMQEQIKELRDGK